MALPEAFPRERVRPQEAVVLVSLIPGSMSFDVELQRAPDSGGSAGTYVTIAKLPPMPLSGHVHRDVVPDAGTSYWYRARHIRTGYTAGDWTTSASAQAPKAPRTLLQRALAHDPATPRLNIAPDISLTGTVINIGTVSTNQTIDWSRSHDYDIVLAGSITLTFSTIPDAVRVRLRVEQGVGGSHTITWPASVVWPGGAAPTLTTTVGRADLFEFYQAGIGGGLLGRTLGLNYLG